MHKTYPTYKYPSGEVQNESARFVRLDNSDTCPFEHFHAHAYNEIQVFKEAGGNHNINFENHQIAGNSIHLLAAHDLHWVERPVHATGFAIVYKDQFLHRLQMVNPHFDFYSIFSHSRVINLSPAEVSDFEFIFRELLCHQDQPAYMLQVIATFLTKIAHLNHFSLPVHKTGDPIVPELIKLVDSNFKTKKTVDFYANELNLTTRTLQNRLKKASLITLNELLQQRLIKEAKKLLCTKEMSIGAIATELGFKETAHFSNWFHKNVNCCPMAYKHEND